MLDNIFLTLVFTHVFLSTLCNYNLIKKVNEFDQNKAAPSNRATLEALIQAYEKLLAYETIEEE